MSKFIFTNCGSNPLSGFSQELPVYFDELFMSKFLEDFLDDHMTDEQYLGAFSA